MFPELESILNDQVLSTIVRKLTAEDIANAAPVSRQFKRVCDEVLNQPKLVSAISTNWIPKDAVSEVFEKVFAEPIRPTFVIVSMTSVIGLFEIHTLLKEKLHGKVPMITCLTSSTAGCVRGSKETEKTNGLVVTVVCLPGVKVEVVPLIDTHGCRTDASSSSNSCIPYMQKEAVIASFIDKIRTFMADYTVPNAVNVFHKEHIRIPIERIDQTLNRETPIVGCETLYVCFCDGHEQCDSRSEQKGKEVEHMIEYAAVALVIAKQNITTQDVGTIHFKLAISSALTPIGPTYGIPAIRINDLDDHWTYLHDLQLTNQELQDILDAEANPMNPKDMYIGFNKIREMALAGEQNLHEYLDIRRVRIPTSMGDPLMVYGLAITSNDTFRFYIRDDRIADVSDVSAIESLKTTMNGKEFGALLLCTRDRDIVHYMQACDDGLPGVPICGMIGDELLARSPSHEAPAVARALFHLQSTVYFVMSHVQASKEKSKEKAV